MKLLRLLLPLILLGLAGCASQHASTDSGQAYVAEDTSRTVDLTHPPRDMWDRIRRGFAIPNLHSDRVAYWVDYYSSHPQSVERMSQRAGKYLYYIVDELNRRGLPTELALLPFVESAYDPTALSRSQASGLWQFIPSTGTQYKLQQTWWRDQRRDPVASTQAALDYLSYLYDMQGDWYLALASYNWGEGAVQRAMKKTESKGLPPIYTALDLPDETLNYVPKLQAIKNIIAQPKKYGVVLPAVSNQPYFTTVHKSRDMDIAVAAALAEMPLDEFRALNPAYKRPVMLASHQPALHLPLDKVDTFNRNLQAYSGPLTTWQVYQPKRGQSLAVIARHHGITLSELREANQLGRKQLRATTAALLIPATSAASGSAPSGDDIPSEGRIIRVAYTPKSGASPTQDPESLVRRLPRQHTPNVRTHTIRRGDTLYSLARRYHTSVDALRKLNNIKGSALSTGQRLRVPGTDVRG